MNETQAAIRVNNLSKRFGDITAVDGIEFEVPPGQIFGFLGPNGSGKTTTIRMLLGLMQPTSGSIIVLGMPVNGSTVSLRPLVGYMSQRFSLYNDLTVLQNLRFYGAAYGLSKTTLESQIHISLDLAGLAGHEAAKTSDLSYGWRQRLALGAAILHQPKVLFLDEPTAGVDPVSRRAFWDLLYRQVAEGVTVFVTTHYMDEAEHCHQVAFIQHGRIIASGSPAAIKESKMRGQVLEISPSNASEAVRVLREVKASGLINLEEIELFGSLVHVVAEDAGKKEYAIRAELRKAGIQIDQISLIEPSLEDVFISCMSAESAGG